MSFSAGDIIYLLRSVNGEWLEGFVISYQFLANSLFVFSELQANSSRGIFPLSFVEIVVGLDEIYDRSLESEHTNPAELSVIGYVRRRKSQNLKFFTVAWHLFYMILLHVFQVSFKSTNKKSKRKLDELTVKAGESLNIIQILGTEWIKCQNPVTGIFLHIYFSRNKAIGESGLVPQNFLHLFLNESLESNTLTDEDSTFHQVFSIFAPNFVTNYFHYH